MEAIVAHLDKVSKKQRVETIPELLDRMLSTAIRWRDEYDGAQSAKTAEGMVRLSPASMQGKAGLSRAGSALYVCLSSPYALPRRQTGEDDGCSSTGATSNNENLVHKLQKELTALEASGTVTAHYKELQVTAQELLPEVGPCMWHIA